MPEIPAVAASEMIQNIPVDQIKPSPHQARKDFDEKGIKQLAVSVDKEGLIQPITLRKVGDGYEVISGERRLRAVKSLGRPTIEARVIEVVNEAAACAKGLVENLQRKDLNPIEEAEGFQSLNRLDPNYWNQTKIAEISGKSQSDISRSLRFLGFSEEIKENMRRRIITIGHAVELLLLPEGKLREKVAKKIEDGLSVMETRKLVDKLLAKAAGKGAPSSQSPAGLKKDPLAARWKELKLDLRMASAGAWGVAFKKGKWIFTVDSAGVGTQEALATWFRQVGEALGKAVPASSEAPEDSDSADVVDISDKTGGVMAMQKRAKLPKTPEEEAELYALAAKSTGPGPIYARIYGPKNPLTQLGETMTWAQFQVSDPKEGLRQLLDAIRKAQGVKP